MKGLWLTLAMVVGAAGTEAWEWRAAWDALRGERDAAAGDVHMGEGVYRVTGYGAAPVDASSEAQARLMALGAAQLDALGKLAAILEGADVSSQREAGDYVQVRYAVEERSRAYLKGVRTLETRYRADGSAEVDVELVLTHSGQRPDFASLEGFQVRPGAPLAIREVATLGRRPVVTKALRGQGPADRASSVRVTPAAPVPPSQETEPSPGFWAGLDALFGRYDAWGGENAREGAPSDSTETEEKPAATPGASCEVYAMGGDVTVIPPEVSAAGDVTVIPPEGFPVDPEAYTDLVLDTRGLGVVPALRPKAFTTSGSQIYPFQGGEYARFAPATEPKLRYVKSMAEAKGLPGFGPRPLLVEVEGVCGEAQTDLVLPGGAVRKLAALRTSRVRNGEGYVVILID